MKRPPSFGQHFRIGRSPKRELIRVADVERSAKRCTTSWQAPSFDMFRPRMEQMNALLEQAPAFAQIGRRFRLENELNLLREIVDALDAATPAPCGFAIPWC